MNAKKERRVNDKTWNKVEMANEWEKRKYKKKRERKVMKDQERTDMNAKKERTVIYKKMKQSEKTNQWEKRKY